MSISKARQRFIDNLINLTSSSSAMGQSSSSSRLPAPKSTSAQTLFLELLWLATKKRGLDYRFGPGAELLRCKNGTHNLICGHQVNEVHGYPKSCTLACLHYQRRRCATAELAEPPQSPPNGAPIMVESINDLADRLTDTEDIFTCPYCWLVEILKKWFYFAEASQQPIGRVVFDTMEVIENPLSIRYFPNLVEISRKIDGKVYAWFGPRAVLDAQMSTGEGPELNARIARVFLNGDTTDETPMATLPTRPSFATLLRSKHGHILEVKLVPIDSKVKKTITWNDDTRVREIPARESPKETSKSKRRRGSDGSDFFEDPRNMAELIDSLFDTGDSCKPEDA